MRVHDNIRQTSSNRSGNGFVGFARSMATVLARTPVVSACCLASMLLFAASLTQDCFFIDRAENPRAWSSGFGLLAVGWLGILTGVYAWLANPTLLIAWLAMWSPNHKRYSIGASTIALLLALSFLLYESLMTDEAGNRSRVTGYGIGYWLWIGSIVLALVGSCSWLVGSDQKLKNERSRVQWVAVAIGLSLFAGAAIAGSLLGGILLGLAATYAVKTFGEFYCDDEEIP